MVNTALTLLLSAQLLCGSIPGSSPEAVPAAACMPPAPIQESRLWWGMIDPELAAWLARLPIEEEAEEPVLWDWSFRHFLAALFGQPLVKEESTDAPCA